MKAICYYQQSPPCTEIKTHPHFALLGPLLELDSLLVESLDGSFEVIDSYANMSETLSNIIVSRSVTLERIILLCLSGLAT